MLLMALMPCYLLMIFAFACHAFRFDAIADAAAFAMLPPLMPLRYDFSLRSCCHFSLRWLIACFAAMPLPLIRHCHFFTPSLPRPVYLLAFAVTFADDFRFAASFAAFFFAISPL